MLYQQSVITEYFGQKKMPFEAKEDELIHTKKNNYKPRWWMLRRQTLSQHISVFELNDSCFRFRFGYNGTKRTHIYTRITNTAEKPVDISRFSSVYMIQTRKKNFRFHGTWTTRAIDRAISPSSVPKQRIYQTKFGNEHTDPSAYRLHTYTHTVQYMCVKYRFGWFEPLSPIVYLSTDRRRRRLRAAIAQWPIAMTII